MQNGFVLKAKSAVKKIAAISAGALMTGATMFGAVAATTLADYPSPFITGGKWVGLIVVGSDAAAGDIIGATDIAATLAQGATVSAGSAGVTVAGGKSQDVPINGTLYSKFGGSLSASDLAGFQDTSVTIDRASGSQSYNVKDEITFGTDSPRLTTGIMDGSTSKDWGSDIWMVISASGKVTYKYSFKTSLASPYLVANSSSDYPTTINFLGKNLRITSATQTGITADVGTEVFLNVDDTTVINGKTVKLINVGSATTNPPVIVDIDGVQQTVTGTQLVNGLRVKVKSTFYSDTRAERSATLIIGTDATKTFQSGEPYIGEDTNDPNWTWSLIGLDTATPTIAIVNAKSLTTPASTTNKPIKMGETFSGPGGGYFKIGPTGASTTSYKDYTFNYIAQGVDLYYNNNTLRASAKPGVEITATGGGKNAFLVDAKYTDKLFLYADGNAAGNNITTYWANPDQGNHYQNTSTVVTSGTALTEVAKIVTPDDTSNIALKVGFQGTKGLVGVTGVQTILTNSTLGASGFAYLGAALGTSAANEITVIGTNAGILDVSTLDSSGRTQDGIVLNSIKSNADGDMVKLSIPSKVYGSAGNFVIKTVVSGTGTTVTTATGGAVVVSPVSGVPVAKLDTEVADKTAYNMILVGGPAVNRLTADALGLSYPAGGQPALDALKIAANEGTLKLISNAFGGTKVALIVAGYEVADTRNAAGVLKDYTTYKLSGDQMIVKSAGGVISVSAPAVTATA